MSGTFGHGRELSPLGSSLIVQTLSSSLGLKALPIHIDWILASLICFTALYALVAEPLTKAFFPKQWAAFTQKQKKDWRIRVVSLAQSLLLGPAALYILWVQKTREEPRSLVQRVYEYYEPDLQVNSIALGYFLWHFAMMVIEYKKYGMQMVVHAVIGVSLTVAVYHPFINTMTSWFIVYELTNIPHNVYKFLTPLGLELSPLSIANASLWIVSFLLVRILWGTYASIAYVKDLYSLWNTPITAEALGSEEFAVVERLRQQGLDPKVVGTPVLVWCTSCAVILAALNYTWFYLIVKTTVRKVSSNNASQARSRKSD